MSQIQTFAPTTAGRVPAPPTRRATADFPTKALPGVSLRLALTRLRAWHLRRAERAAVRSLLGASDHVLNDIGLSRADLDDLMRSL